MEDVDLKRAHVEAPHVVVERQTDGARVGNIRQKESERRILYAYLSPGVYFCGFASQFATQFRSNANQNFKLIRNFANQK